MTIQRFQNLVLRIGNQMFVRHLLWLNYPLDPQIMGLQFTVTICERRYAKARSCECGKCKKCQHRDYMAKYRPPVDNEYSRLHAELVELGFQWHEGFAAWIIERTEGPAEDQN